MRSSWLILIIIFFSLCSEAQVYEVSGRVIDSESRVTLPFVNIIINDGIKGGTTDIDGKFLFRSHEEIKVLTLSYVGYESQKYIVRDKSQNLIIKLKKVEYELPEFVVFPTENPAHRIIRNAVAYRDYNDPEKLPAFTYTSYDKMIFTLELDSIPMLDTIAIDSTNEFREFLDKHHLFIMETVSERKFLFPDKNHEEVIATKVAGFKDPIFVFLLSQMQSTTFYNDRIRVAEKTYINPISKGSTEKYFFLLQDTLYSGEKDTVFVISFRPKKKTNFEGLEGVISINSRNWAIQNVIAEPADRKGSISLRIEQMYEFIGDKQWFPVQLNTIAILNNVKYNDSTRQMYIASGSSDTSGVGFFRLPFGFGKSYIKDINLNPDLKKREFGSVVVNVNPEAAHRDTEYWMNFRIDSLSQKEINTYDFVDSISREANLDRMAKTFESLLTGKIPWGYIDLDINRFLKYNDYEGFALGAGIHTNDRVSQVFKVGGFFRYGFGDKAFKYGGDFDVKLYYPWELALNLEYQNDVSETSGITYFDDKPGFFKPEYFRDFLIKKMDLNEFYKASVSFRAMKYFKFDLAFIKSEKEVNDDYRYAVSNENVKVLFNQYDFTEARIGLRYAYGEKFVQNMRKKISMGTDYPIIWMQYTRGLQGVLDGDFDYNRMDIKVEKSFYTKYIGKTSLKLAAGYVDADIPYTNLYNGNGAYRVFTIFAENSFATMRMNEFLSNKYAALYFTHNFESLLYKGKKFKPELALATNIAFGALDFKDSHLFVDYKTLEKGYYESGLQFNRLLNLQLYNVGLAFYYRYGPYTLPNGWDNLAIKFTIKFAFTRFQ